MFHLPNMVSFPHPGNFKTEIITPALYNHAKENFALSKAFLGGSQRMVREFYN